MPWQKTDPMKERVKFVLEWEKRWNAGEGRMNFAELCREFGISRQVGYGWLGRYRESSHDVQSIAERSRRPLTSPSKVSEELEDFIVAARKLHPTWGPKKLRSWLQNHNPQVVLPSPSTLGEILRRRGMTMPHQRKVRTSKATTQPFAATTGPNSTWCVDFKGNFKTGDGINCYPLTLIDDYSRLLLRCEGLLDPDGRQVQRIFDSAFCEFGLPAAIRSDNGPPFASVGAGGLTKLSVWWLRLGIRVERIAPGKPQQNGRQERCHRTLKAETAKPPKANLTAQQRAFDLFRKEYNEERPHEALHQRPPVTAYARSARRYPRPLERFEVEYWNQAMRVDKKGFIQWENQPVFISTALAHEDVKLRYDGEDEHWDVVFGPLLIGRLHFSAKGPSLRATRGRMADLEQEKVSGMSSD
jgi:transposase InsO family protein